MLCARWQSIPTPFICRKNHAKAPFSTTVATFVSLYIRLDEHFYSRIVSGGCRSTCASAVPKVRSACQ